MLHVTLCGKSQMAIKSLNARVQKHRDALRMAGLRPVQIWVPDTRRPDFADECRRQSRLVAQADTVDADMLRLLDAALTYVDAWTP
jgi:Protein  of unknown function (DUF3018)